MSIFETIDRLSLAGLPFSDSEWVLSSFLVLTQLGDARVVVIVLLAMAVVLWRRGYHDYWIALGISVIGASVSAFLLKILVARPRPAEALIDIAGYSLPSGHAATSFALYGFIAYVAYKLMHPPHHRTPLMIFMLSLATLISLSRLYLGVHYPTDVLAGITLGVLWVFIAIRLLPRLTAHIRRS